MAELPPAELIFDGGRPDPGRREVEMPPPLPPVGDDFDWHVRDYDSFRSFMLNQLKERFPERQRWTPADMEAVLIELFAVALDQLSDMADRVVAESFLETARRPESVYQWLRFIGVRPERDRGFEDDKEKLLEHWRQNPHDMEHDRRAGPGSIHHQERMATLQDYAVYLEKHPLVLRAQASRTWGGSWPVVWATVSLWENKKLDERVWSLGDDQYDVERKKREKKVEAKQVESDEFHKNRGLLPLTKHDDEYTRDMLRNYIARYRMIGQEVVLRDVVPVGIDLSLDVQVGRHYFQSEVRREVGWLLGRGPGGFFEPGRLGFGQAVHIGDFYERLMAIDGVENVNFLRFKRYGGLHPDRMTEGVIPISQMEIAVCDNDTAHPARGGIKLQVNGGRPG